MNAPQCPDCRKVMKEGFIPDSSYAATLQSGWYPGPPDKATFLGMPNGVEVFLPGIHPIQAFRCPDCGLLRAYAFPKSKRK
jgi:hypothetical protein